MIVEPTETERRRARRMILKARGLSLAVVSSIPASLYAFALVTGSDPVTVAVSALPPILLGLLILAISPVGTFVSLLTIWTGRWVPSCPYCPLVHVERIETEFMECDSCGARSMQIAPIVGPGWVTHHGDEIEHSCRDCTGLP